MRQKMLLVLNPCAGRRRANRYLEQIRKILADGGFDVDVFTTSARGDATEKVRRCAKDYDRVAVIGGDGSLNEVISGMIASGAGVPIGYIPAGTTNDLARSLHLSTAILRAAQDVTGAGVFPMDIGCFNGRYFVYTASFGAFTRASYAAPQQVKNTLGHLAYLLEGAKDITRIRPVHLEIEAGDQRFSEDYIFGAISNSTSMGGILKLDPRRVDLRDGKFEVMLIRAPAHVTQLINTIAALQWRNYEHDSIRFLTVDQVRIVAGGQMPWTLDGEYAEGTEEIDIRVLPGAVNLIVPEIPDMRN